ncbi:MAG: hypothetical protein ACJAY5_001653 [Actinomycetes bacterium]|jgi:hypothetical protein
MDKEEREEAAPEAPTDPKEQMRLALERKHSKEKAGESHTDGQAKADHASGPSGGEKMFRRKSGG